MPTLMACGNFFDDIDEKLFHEITKNKELMKALGPLKSNRFDDLNYQMKQDLSGNKITQVPSSTTISPPSFSITQALTIEEETKPKFLYPCQIKSEPSSVSRPLGPITKSSSCIPENSFKDKCNQSKDISSLSIQLSKDITCQKEIPKLSNNPIGLVNGCKSASFEPIATPPSSNHDLATTSADGCTSPVLRKSRRFIRKRIKGSSSSISTQSTPKCDIKSTVESASDQKTPNSGIQERSVAQKRPSTPQVDEFNPWKKKPDIKPPVRMLSGSFNKIASSITPARGDCSSNNMTNSRCVSSSLQPTETLAVSCYEQRQPLVVISSAANSSNSCNVESNCMLKLGHNICSFQNKEQDKNGEKGTNSSETYQVDDIIEDIACSPCTGFTKSDCILPNPIATKNLRVTCSTDQNVQTKFVGFKTASKKPLTVSATSWERAADLIANVDSPSTNDLNKPVTAGRGVTVSKNAWNKACKIIKKPNSNSSMSDHSATSKLCTTNNQKTNAENEDLTEKTSVDEVCSENQSTVLIGSTKEPLNTDPKTSLVVFSAGNVQTTGFTTASKKPLTVSSEALVKAQSIIDEDKPSEFSISKGLSTTCNKPLSISKQSWERIQHLFNGEPTRQTDNTKPTIAGDTPCVVQNLNNLKNSKSVGPGINTSKYETHAVLTPITKTLNIVSGVCSERKPTARFSSCAKARRRNSSYKPPRRKISLDQVMSLKSHCPIDADVSEKENTKGSGPSTMQSAKRKLGMKQTQEDQIQVSDESLLMAMELFENI